MTTDDKRNEIAAKLRKAASENNVDIACALNDALRGETKQRGVNEDCKNCASATLREIADLIEPQAERTCEPIEVLDENDFGLGVYHECSECHETLGYEPWPSYCPHCGAKVVDE